MKNKKHGYKKPAIKTKLIENRLFFIDSFPDEDLLALRCCTGCCVSNCNSCGGPPCIQC